MFFIKILKKKQTKNNFQVEAYWPKPESITYISGDFLLEIMAKEPSKAGSELR